MLDGELHIAVQFRCKLHHFHFFCFFSCIGEILFNRNFCRIYRGLRTTETYPHFFVQARRIIIHIDGKYLRLFLIGQSQHRLNVIEFVHVLSLVEQDFAVGIVDDTFLYDRRLDDVIHFLRNDYCLAKEFPNRLKKILDVFGPYLMSFYIYKVDGEKIDDMIATDSHIYIITGSRMVSYKFSDLLINKIKF